MKPKNIYVCSSCGITSPKWQGKCNSCGAWDSFTEDYLSKSKKKSLKSISLINKPIQLKNIETNSNYRIKTNIDEFDRVLGGGIIPGSVVLIGGDPGIGKSTLMLQMLVFLENYLPLYVTGEESLEQIKFRSQRLNNVPLNLQILAETNIEIIIDTIKRDDYKIIIIDSIQSVYSDLVEATPGSIVQVRECASLLMRTAKETGKAIFIIGHITKEGIIAGPKILEHMVDTVLQFEGEKNYAFRIIRALKNRFGSTNEIGIFEMTESGLNEVSNPSEIFLAQRKVQDSGIVVVAVIEGSRPILLELQALVSPTSYSVPQRSVNGFEVRRLQMLIAVLEKRLGLSFRQSDVFVNIAGGIYLNDPSLDLGISVALVSSIKNYPINSKTVIIGEVGLTGEVRRVISLDQRLSESEKLGFQRAVIPELNKNKLNKNYNLELVPVERLSLALDKIFIN